MGTLEIADFHLISADGIWSSKKPWLCHLTKAFLPWALGFPSPEEITKKHILLSTKFINQKAQNLMILSQHPSSFLFSYWRSSGTSCSVRDGILVALWKVKWNKLDETVFLLFNLYYLFGGKHNPLYLTMCLISSFCSSRLTIHFS